MKKLTYIFTSLIILSKFVSASSNYLVFTPEQVQLIKSAIVNDDANIKPFVRELREMAEYCMDQGPWSVTFSKGKAISGDPHDYYSESPYWWPNPDDPDGPYIRKDGLRNPDRFMDHKNGLQKMHQTVSILSMAGFFLNKPEYTDRALYLLRVWFIDDETRMNPHLDYGQAIPNKSSGRGVGIIDTHRLAKMITFLGFIEASGQWLDKDKAELKNWFRSYLNWMLTSKNGTDEQNQGNNHSTWWAVQVAAYANFTDDDDTSEMIWDFAHHTLLEKQIASDGRFPLEEKRTRSFDYTLFNLNAFALLFRMAELQDVDLWRVTNSERGSIETTMDYVYPYLRNPASWKGKQIIPSTEREPFSILFYGEYANQSKYIDLYKNLRKVRNLKSAKSYDPFVLLVNLYSCVL